MVFVSSFFACAIGGCLGIVLVATSKGFLQTVLNMIVNIGRSFPFALLVIALIPFTRLLVGTSLGTTASIVPLTIAAIPFVARLVEQALSEVDKELVDVAKLFGATRWQIIGKVLLCEAKPSLIQAATLTIINVISYSAVAGMCGGGGLGKVAIQYGYYRFDTEIMFSAVAIMILLVQLVQVAGSRIVRIINAKRGLCAIFALLICTGCSQQNPQLRIAASSVPHAQILSECKKQGIDIEVIVMDEYTLMNRALHEGQVDANFFQHRPFMLQEKQAHHYAIEELVAVHVEPMGIYSRRGFSHGARISVPNDPTNEQRALLLLQREGWITVEDIPNITIQNITSNPYNLHFLEIDAAMLIRTLEEVDAAVIPANFALQAGLQPLACEAKESLYCNIVAVREGETRRAELVALKEALTSETIRNYIKEQFHGAVVPVF